MLELSGTNALPGNKTERNRIPSHNFGAGTVCGHLGIGRLEASPPTCFY